MIRRHLLKAFAGLFQAQAQDPIIIQPAGPAVFGPPAADFYPNGLCPNCKLWAERPWDLAPYPGTSLEDFLKQWPPALFPNLHRRQVECRKCHCLFIQRTEACAQYEDSRK